MAKAKKQEPTGTTQATEAKKPAPKRAAKAAGAEAPAAAASSGAASASKGAASASEGAVSASKGSKSAASAPMSAKAAKGAKSGKPTAGAPGGATAMSIDTNLAAQAAANMVVHRDMLTGSAASPETDAAASNAPPAPRKESAGFQQLKQGLNKPSALGGLLGPAGGQKKSNQNFGPGGANFRNQTTGGFNRTGVPRRTSG